MDHFDLYKNDAVKFKQAIHINDKLRSRLILSTLFKEILNMEKEKKESSQHSSIN